MFNRRQTTLSPDRMKKYEDLDLLLLTLGIMVCVGHEKNYTKKTSRMLPGNNTPCTQGSP
jgi:hypothetical protein